MFQKIIQVNALLQAQGKEVVQKIQIGNRTALFGYKPQCVIDAVNEVFGPENWQFELYDTELFTTGDDNKSGQVVVSMEVFLRSGVDDEFISHGPQFGQSQIVFGNVGDAKKGAITDGLGKGLSLFSIGNTAYRGELEAVFNGKQAPATPKLTAVPTNQPKAVTPPPSVPEQEETEGDLPKLPGVRYETAADGTILAQGDTYNNRNLLKSMGFTWLPKDKAWGLKQAA